MHLYNAWLPPPVALETTKEKESFALVVNSLKDSYRPDDLDSVYSTLKWVSVIDLSVFLLFLDSDSGVAFNGFLKFPPFLFFFFQLLLLVIVLPVYFFKFVCLSLSLSLSFSFLPPFLSFGD